MRPIGDRDSGSLLSLLGQSRCEKKEGAHEIEKGRKKRECALSTSHKFSLSSAFPQALSLFLHNVFVNLSPFSRSPLHHLSVLLLALTGSKYFCFPPGSFNVVTKMHNVVK